MKQITTIAQNNKCNSILLYELWSTLYLRFNKIEESINVVHQGIQLNKNSSTLWLLYTQLMMKKQLYMNNSNLSSNEFSNEIIKIYQTSLQSTTIDQPVVIWSNYLEYLLTIQYDWEFILQQYRRAIGILGNDSSIIRVGFTERIFLSYGIEKAREIIDM